MPVNLQTPVTETITKVIKEAMISEINIDVFRKQIAISVAFGETKNNSFITNKRKQVIIKGDDFTALSTKSVDGGKNIYDNIGAICYAWLAEKGQLKP